MRSESHPSPIPVLYLKQNRELVVERGEAGGRWQISKFAAIQINIQCATKNATGVSFPPGPGLALPLPPWLDCC